GIGVAIGSSIAGPLIDASGYAAGFAVVVGFGSGAALIAVGSRAGLHQADAQAAASTSAINDRDTIFD
ncbi:MAG TPA: hypothetical protein VLR88_00220, partial [Propionibacteriaceae bacterium]|nr:hypothetical protein [Propionibacteriaceae bacterium]